MLNFKVLSGAEGCLSIVESWFNLWEETDDPNPFLHPFWQLAWMETIGCRLTVKTLCAFEGGELLAIWPLQKGLDGLWRPSGLGVSDYLHPLGMSPDELVDGVVRDAAWTGTISAPYIPCAPGGVRIGSSSQLVLEGDREAFWAAVSKNLKRDALQAAKAGVVAVWRKEEGVLMELMEAHQAHWRSKKMPGSFWKPAVRQFHLAALRRGAPIHVLRAEREGKHLGSLYLIETSARLCFYQACRVPCEERLSIGTFLVYEAIRWAQNRGKKFFDFLRGEEAYKRRWKPDLETPLGWFQWQGGRVAGVRLALERKKMLAEAVLKKRFEK
jgi:CelD/BcsL family acetyltransferase involved in cellulose biosynthesis